LIVLDTNVIAELMRPRPEPKVMAWADRLAPGTAGLTSMNEAEILHGIARLPEGRRREALQRSWDTLLPALFHERVWEFDREAAHWSAQVLRQRERLGRPMTTADAVIAATTLARSARLATRNVADFEGIGIDLINPWQAP
jgi:predicted nucleic acid-binding protein